MSPARPLAGSSTRTVIAITTIFFLTVLLVPMPVAAALIRLELGIGLFVTEDTRSAHGFYLFLERHLTEVIASGKACGHCPARARAEQERREWQNLN